MHGAASPGRIAMHGIYSEWRRGCQSNHCHIIPIKLSINYDIDFGDTESDTSCVGAWEMIIWKWGESHPRPCRLDRLATMS